MFTDSQKTGLIVVSSILAFMFGLAAICIMGDAASTKGAVSSGLKRCYVGDGYGSEWLSECPPTCINPALL